MPKISGVHTQTYMIDSEGKTYTFTKTFDGSSSTNYIAIDEDGRNNKIVLQGVADSNPGYGAIQSHGRNVDIHIAETGFLSGDGLGLIASGANAHIFNDGSINGSSTGSAVNLSDNAVKAVFINNATIESAGEGIDFRGDGSRVVNNKGAVVDTVGYAIRFAGDEGAKLEFVNHGKIESTNIYGVVGGESDDTIRSDGRIVGIIRLNEGNDVIDLRGGKLVGSIIGDGGDDTLITDDAAYTMSESAGKGFDTVRSTVSYTLSSNVERLVLLGDKDLDGWASDTGGTLVGNSGDNTLWGGDNSDTLDGRGGRDILRGGEGADLFIFSDGYGKDRIKMFEAGSDGVYLQDWKAIKSFNDMINNHASNHGADVWIADGKDVLIIEGMHKPDLLAEDFHI